jgi:pilus assembly protein FimV
MFNDKGKSMGLRQLSILIVGLVGLMASAFSFALGLGEVTLKSSYNEPLNAEIRLLQPQNLSAEEMLISLASQEDFTRIGLDRDFFLTDLRFSIVITNPNNAYIKVTSTKPVQEPYLNFLVDLQWPSGRLLREYTVLLDLPVFEAEQPVQVAVAPPVSAPLPVPVVKVVKPVAPAVSPPVSRPAEISPPANAQPLPDRVLASNSSKFSNIEDAADSFIRTLSRQAAERQSSFEIQPPPVAKTEQYVPNKQVAAPVPIKQEDLTSSSTSKKVIRTESITSLASAKQIEARRKELEREGGAPVPRPIESFPLASRPKDSLLVKDGDTLWAIALQLRPSSSVSVQQTMLALQEANPTAFIGNNINLLRKGQVLRAPSLAEIEQTSFKQAVAAVRQQTQAWKQQAQAPVLSAVPARAPKKSAAIKQQGRLTLGSADSKDKGKVVKGAGASGKGESLQNDLAIAQEELDKAARVNSNLKTRVAELEEQIKTLEGLVTLTNDQFKALELTTAKVSQDKLPVNIEPVPATSEQNAPADDSVAEKIVDGQDIDATLTTDTNTSETLIAKIMATVTEHIQLVGIALLALLLLIWFIVRSTNDDGDDDFNSQKS